MAAAILVITLGGIMVFSALKGESIVDTFAGGGGGDTLNPHGSSGALAGALSNPSNIPSVTGLPTTLGSNPYRFQGPNAALLATLAQVATHQFQLGIPVPGGTYGGVHVSDSYHYRHRAFDASGKASDMAAFFDYVHQNYKSSIAELFYDPKGAVKNGKDIPAIGGHTDHVHVAA